MEKARDQQQDTRGDGRRPQDLDRRYGEIGISAVAGAVRHKGEMRRDGKDETSRYAVYDCD